MIKGESGVETIIYVALFSAALITVLWAVQRISPIQLEMQRVNEDIESIALLIGEACNSYEYNKRYEPRTSAGLLSFYDNHYCVNTTRLGLCSPTNCDVGYHNIDLEGIINIRIIKYHDEGDIVYEILGE
ncbi:MAG: hypothetical protein ACMXYL_05110 [Candidatus Woesearchaeota archaeon]